LQTKIVDIKIYKDKFENRFMTFLFTDSGENQTSHRIIIVKILHVKVV